MLRVGEADNKKKVKAFCAYLASQDIQSDCVEYEGQYELWIERAEQLEMVKKDWASYLDDSSQARFSQRKDHRAEKAASRKLKSSYRKNFKRQYNSKWLTITLMTISVVVYGVLQTPERGLVLSKMLLYAPMGIMGLLVTSPWQLVTPIFLHFSILHIVFNMYWLYVLGGLIETKEKNWKYGFLIFFAAVFSNLIQYWVSGPAFGGMSGVVYALFAYIWLSSRLNPMSGYWVRRDLVVWMLGWFVLCFTGFLGPVANFAHLGGLLMGALFAGLSAWRA